MKILVVGHGHGATMNFTDDDVGSGWENLCLAFGGKWYSLDEASTMEADAVLYIGTHPSVRELAARGRPKGWRRCLMLQESGSGLLNDAGYALDVFHAAFDALLVYSLPLVERFAIFGVPIFPVVNGYPFGKHADLRESPREHKVMLYLQHLTEPGADATGTLAMFKRLGEDVRGVTFVEAGLAGRLNDLLWLTGLSYRIAVRQLTSWRAFLEELATCKVAASMDGRQTWGRLDLDCALVGIRCVGPYTATKARLFPSQVARTIGDCAALTQAELDKAEPRYPIPDDVMRDFDARIVAERIRHIVRNL